MYAMLCMYNEKCDVVTYDMGMLCCLDESTLLTSHGGDTLVSTVSQSGDTGHIPAGYFTVHPYRSVKHVCNTALIRINRKY